MPQLDLHVFISQYLWFILVFSCFYVFCAVVILPRILFSFVYRAAQFRVLVRGMDRWLKSSDDALSLLTAEFSNSINRLVVDDEHLDYDLVSFVLFYRFYLYNRALVVGSFLDSLSFSETIMEKEEVVWSEFSNTEFCLASSGMLLDCLGILEEEGEVLDCYDDGLNLVVSTWLGAEDGNRFVCRIFFDFSCLVIIKIYK